MHPLPRVGELDASFDSDTRAVYFQQAAYGVPIRMALIALLLDLRRGKSLQKFEGGFEAATRPLYSQPLTTGMRCINANCISHEPMESQYVRNKFYVVTDPEGGCRLRCFYCERDIDDFVVASKRNQWFTEDQSTLKKADVAHLRDLVAFAGPAEAEAAGFHHKRQAPASALRGAR
jgi:hypothetical protein